MTLNMRSPVVRSKCDAKVEQLVPPPCTRTRPAWWKQSGSSPRKFSTHGFATFGISICTCSSQKPAIKTNLLILIGSLFWQEWIHQTYITWLWFWLKNQFSELSTVLPITDHTTMMLLAAERSNQDPKRSWENSSSTATIVTSSILFLTNAAESSSRSSPKELYLVTVLWAPGPKFSKVRGRGIFKKDCLKKWSQTLHLCLFQVQALASTSNQC